jgi:hypothetical protein
MDGRLVCDDLDNESADFILADSARSLVAFIHAKASSSWHPYSASALGPVCDQAMKNVRYLAKFASHEVPANCPKWGTMDWKFKKRAVNRVLRGPKGVTGQMLWEEIQHLIRDPYAQCEVWLLLGQMFSAHEFRKRLTASSPEPEAVQAAYLLLSTMTSVYSVGARLRVFCSP